VERPDDPRPTVDEQRRRTAVRWTDEIDLVGAGLPEAGHSLSSDDFGWAAVRLPGRRLFLAVVSDGVGSTERKRDASHLAVRKAIQWAAAPPTTLSLAELARDCVQAAHREVLTHLDGAGLATLVLALVDADSERLAWASVGDSTVSMNDEGGAAFAS
jgi:hypothetical protein